MNNNSIIRSHDLRAENRYRVLNTLRHNGPQTRGELGKLTHLSAAALSTLINEMIEQGFLHSTLASETPRRGRPQATINLQASAATAATVAITIDRLHVALTDYAGEVFYENVLVLDTRALGSHELLQSIQHLITDAVEINAIKQLSHISLGVQGVVDQNNGILLWSPITKGTHIAIQDHIHKLFNVPTSVNNDCRLIADALHFSEASKLGNSFASVLFSNGVGMGIYFQGKAFSGTQSSALEIGHVLHRREGARCRCGKFGCIEAYTSNYGILRSANNGDPLAEPPGEVDVGTITALAKQAKNGDKQASKAFSIAGRALGEGLASVFTLLDPMPVALVGHNQEVVDQMMDELLVGLSNIGRPEFDLQSLLHPFENATPLLQKGLSLDATFYIDRAFAHRRHAETHAQGITQ